MPRLDSLVNATTGTGLAYDSAWRGPSLVAVLTPTGVVTGGVVILEESAFASDGNQWSQIATFSTPAGGVTQALHVTGNFLLVRARILSPITGGGNVTVTLGGA